ncbi:MAG TPA: hypothetical protein VGO61_07530 [Steroidobacteraceae bacterium]|nr:hypothetical protein [Steroidobacteraceae bacterium]
MARSHTTLLACIAACALAACAATTFTDTWKAPGQAALDPRGQKVAAVFISTDEGMRRVAEDALVRKLDEYGASGVASYSLIAGEDLDNMERVKERLAAAGVDGIVTLHVIDESKKVTIAYEYQNPAIQPYYWRFTDFWGYGWGSPYVPTEVTTTTILRIETLVYSLKRDALLWAGTSRTSESAKVSRLVEEVADAAAHEMTKQGLLIASRTR